MLGTRDYVRKNGFTDVVIGLSGGIDSSLVAAIAADALGADHVPGVLMPSRYSSDGSVTDAEALAANLGIRTITIPIEPAHEAFTRHARPSRSQGTDAGPGRGEPPGAHPRHAAHGDLEQVRLAGAHDRQQERDGHRLLTLYGDMAGGFAVIKDVPKMLVYALCERPQRSVPGAR